MFDRTLFRFASHNRPGLALTIAFAFAAGLSIIAQAWLVSTVIDAVFLRGRSLSEVWSLLVFAALAAGARAICQAGSEIAANGLAQNVKGELRRMFFGQLVRLGPAFARGERTGELTAVAVEGVEALDAYFREYLPGLVIAVLVPLSVFLVVLPFDLLSALVLLLTAPLIPVFMLLIGNAAEGMTRRQFNLLTRLSAHFLDILQGLTTLKLLGQSRAQSAGIRQASERYAAATLDVLRIAFLSALVLEIVATISTALVAVQIGLRLLYGQMTFQPALMILILAPEFYLPLRLLGQRFHAAASGAAAARRIVELLNTRPEANSQPAAVSLEPGRPAAVASICFRDVGYSYGDRPALRGISFEMNAGEVVALFGPSGAGKSTIVQLLLRFVEPQGGEILVDGVPLREIPPDRWRERIAWVPQMPHLAHDTIAANIRLGRPDASLKELERAAVRAHLDEFIRSLPRGYDTPIGEGGARLSGGQAQRLALARAFLRDAPLLVLDEPTSSVDPETEALLQDSTERLMTGRTVLIIAHRLSTIYRADKIVVLSEGQVVQAGRHDELIAHPGLYRTLALAHSSI